MLFSIQIKNFLSYRKAFVSFKKRRTVSIVGDNGSGKSSFLEAVRFALYGDGRDDLKGLIHLGTDNMSVIVEIENKSSKLKVERGVKKSGTGYLIVTLNGNIEARGGAKPGNNLAQVYLNNYLGNDKDLYSLTSFFGLGESDSLMSVRPSERLDTLQKLSRTFICQKISEEAKKNKKKLEEEIRTSQKVLDTVKSNIGDIKDLEEKLAGYKDGYYTSKEKLTKIYADRNALLKDEDRLRALTLEQAKLSERKKSETGKLRRLVEAIEKSDKTIKKSKSLVKLSIEERDELLGTTSEQKLKVIDKELEELVEAKEKLNTLIGLREIATGAKLEKNCPLCNSPLDEHTSERWKEEVEESREKLAVLWTKIKLKKKEKEDVQIRLSKLSEITLEIKRLMEKTKALEEEIRLDEAEKVKTEFSLSGIEKRYSILKEDLKQYEEIGEKISAFNAEITKVQTKNAECLANGKAVQKELIKSRAQEHYASELEKKIEEETNEVIAFNAVAEGFSRYEIPLALLKKWRLSIELRATKIYQEFNSGLIRIRDVEGAKPGIEFVLIDRMGERAYRSLSEGEKVMIYLAVRVAITQIVNASRDNKIDFLILDEITSHLSPKNNELMTRLISKVLKKYFVQVFMTSHMPIRNIFDQELMVEKVEAVSEIA